MHRWKESFDFDAPGVERLGSFISTMLDNRITFSRRLGEREVLFVMLYFCNNMTQSEIAKEYGVTRQRVQQIIGKFILTNQRRLGILVKRAHKTPRESEKAECPQSDGSAGPDGQSQILDES